ncbi:uncharacterized protein [Dermacentor albipictus]|uniref:uncharacterized protein n=1 Tax=Dermacentor albipictus TaxID=60249 RepID=UPI0031FE13B6
MRIDQRPVSPAELPSIFLHICLCVTSPNVVAMMLSMAAAQTVDVLVKKLATYHRHEVSELQLRNCVVANPSRLCTLISSFTELRCLRCVASLLKPYDVRILLLPALKKLETLEFTIDERLSPLQARSIRNLARCNFAPQFPSLQSIYVEVAGSDNIDIVSDLMLHFPNLNDLHVHFLRGQFGDASDKCRRLWESHQSLRRFTFTSEVPSTACQFAYPHMNSADCGVLCGNVLCTRDPHTTGNCWLMRDLCERKQALPNHQTLVVVRPSSTATEQMRQAGVTNEWTSVKSLCLVLLGMFNNLQYPCASGAYHDALVYFLQQFRSINGHGEYEHMTELNVNSFHCADNLDMTAVLQDAGLTSLTALSASPCGIRRQGALGRLALACPSLNDLDVRVYADVASCERCREGLDVDADDAAELAVSHNGGRLTFIGVPRFGSLDFLSRCNVRELRLGATDCDPPEGLGELLGFNERLRCLVLSYDGVHLDLNLYKNLKGLRNLRLLSVLSTACYDNIYPRAYMQSVGSFMERLKVFHVHFTDTKGNTERLTWVRRAPTVVEQVYRLGPLLIAPVFFGRVLTGAPCVVCTTQTFIGLVKPKYRGVHTKF